MTTAKPINLLDNVERANQIVIYRLYEEQKKNREYQVWYIRQKQKQGGNKNKCRKYAQRLILKILNVVKGNATLKVQLNKRVLNAIEPIQDDTTATNIFISFDSTHALEAKSPLKSAYRTLFYVYLLSHG